MDMTHIQLVAEKVLDLKPTQIEELIENEEDYDNLLKDRFGIDLETFGKVANALIPLTPIIIEPTTNQLIHAFVQFKDDCNTIIARENFTYPRDLE